MMSSYVAGIAGTRSAGPLAERIPRMSLSSVEIPPLPPVTPPAPAAPDLRDPGPIRAELLGLDRLEALARTVAESCRLLPPKRRNSPLLRRFEVNAAVLVKVHARIVAPDDRGEGRGIDAEWLLDNFHIVEEVVREVRHDLPPGYDVELPKLAGPDLAGYPRAFAVALHLVAHTDSELDEARVTRFVEAFQEVAPLTIGELWALPTMLRLVLLENLRRLADQMLWGWDERLRAERFVVDSLASDAADDATADTVVPAPASSPPPVLDPSDPFVVRALQLLRDGGPAANQAIERVVGELHARGVDADETLRREHRRQAANQISVGNCVISLRLVAAQDWKTFFERVSRVEAILRTDPSGVYPLQDFPTRDRQRRAVENLARRSAADERTVASWAVTQAREGMIEGPRRGHVAYHLVGSGQWAMRREFGYRPRPRERLLDWTLAHPRAVYFGSISLLWLVITLGLAASGLGARWTWGTLALAVLALAFPMSDLAVGLVNHLLTLLLPPRTLPKLEYKAGIPPDCATIVVMPTMLVRPQSAAVLLERLEIHYLANPDPGLRFALLTDFADADEEHRPEDEGYVADALERVGELNRRVAPGGPPKFFLFHRGRCWNASQGVWMGWERKRGKLSEFNRLLRGATDTSYTTQSGDPAGLRDVRFVITLDADTRLPRDTARRMVGTLAHPLNAPRFDPVAGRVVEGYGVLQPRVSFLLSAATHSRFAGLLASSGGIDPYSAASSDAYMDLFGLGSFTGKGIYDLDAFEAATGHSFPENAILSHDLIEGNFARCGLLSDTELFDDFPARYHAYARREHRWARGDWQLLPWIGAKVPPSGRKNPLPVLERWKLADNLRRSLVPAALLVLFLLGWTILPGSPWFWTLVGLSVPALAVGQLLIGSVVSATRGRSLSPFRRWRDSVPATIGQVAMVTTFLADQARTLVDAIARTLYRLLISRKNRLEWETAATTERRLGAGLDSFLLTMWPSPLMAGLMAVVVMKVSPASLPAAAVVLVPWAMAPFVAYWLSRPKVLRQQRPTADEAAFLRATARRTWHFFETFVGGEDHWLPPDNYQEEPDGRVAHRTSPTNQGLLLLSTLAAHDLGYIGTRALVERLERTFDTFDVMERHWGHFYNWYDTRTLKPLPPAYISTVDSGNLLGCLVTLRRGLMEAADAPLLPPQVSRGLADTLAVAAAAFAEVAAPDAQEATAVYRGLRDDLDHLARSLDATPATLTRFNDWLADLDHRALGLIGRIRALDAVVGATPTGLEAWARRLAAEIARHRADLLAIAPWADALAGLEGDGTSSWAEIDPSLAWAPSLSDFVASAGDLKARLGSLAEGNTLLAGVAEAFDATAAADLLGRLRQLIERAAGFARAMNFVPLYKPERDLYAIGCNLAQGKLDGACYDLLASESSLTSFLTVARGEAPRKHWFQLGRPFLRVAGRTGLVSWGGTMFEYLMPRLLMKSLDGTLVAEAAQAAVARQIEYGAQTGVPWGISESAFNAQYVEGDYQYQSFGVPGLGLKRGLERDLVIAPYATAMATMIAPRAAVANLRRIAAEGGLGSFGFYEAIDYTRDRVPKGKKSVVVKQFMAHHQGMSLVAIVNTLLDEPMPRRFHAEPMVRAVDLLLQERIPRDAPVTPRSELDAPDPGAASPSSAAASPLMSRRISTADTPTAAHASPLQRQLPRHAHQRGLGGQHLLGSRRHAVARGRHPRPVGPVRLPARSGLGPHLVGRPPAASPPGGRLRGGLLGR